MSQAPKTLVVIPTYNGEKYLRATIESVIAQSHQNWTLVVVDDGSKDSSPQIVKEFESDPRVRLVVSTNRGISGARSLGFKEGYTDHDYVCFLDHDDMWYQSTLERFIHAMEAHPDWVAVHGIGRYIDSQGEPLSLHHAENRTLDMHIRGLFRPIITPSGVDFRPPGEPTDARSLLLCCPVTSVGSMMIRCDAFQKAGGFPDEIRVAEDWQFYLRLMNVGLIGHIAAPVLKYRYHETNASHSDAYIFDGFDETTKLIQSEPFKSRYPDVIKLIEEEQKRQNKLDFSNGIKEVLRGIKRGDMAHAKLWTKRLPGLLKQKRNPTKLFIRINWPEKFFAYGRKEIEPLLENGKADADLLKI